MSSRVGLAIALIVLAVATVYLFLVIDANSHSVSDTLRPFLLTMVPVWAVTLYAARIVLRSKPN